MPDWVIIVLVVAFGLTVGFFVARKSAAKKPLHGSHLAPVFHYLGVSVAVSITPMLLTMAFVFHLPFGPYSGVCLGMFVLEFVFLILYAMFELQTSSNPNKTESEPTKG